MRGQVLELERKERGHTTKVCGGDKISKLTSKKKDNFASMHTLISFFTAHVLLPCSICSCFSAVLSKTCRHMLLMAHTSLYTNRHKRFLTFVN